MQSLLAGLADSHALYGALHALDGLVILGIAGYLARRYHLRFATASGGGTCSAGIGGVS
jgi:hypothetical protein